MRRGKLPDSSAAGDPRSPWAESNAEDGVVRPRSVYPGCVSTEEAPYGTNIDSPESLKRVRIRHFRRAKEQGIKITGLTSYDFLSATHLRPGGHRLPARRRLGRQRRVRLRLDAAGDDRGADPAVPGRGARRQAGARRRRHAVRLVRGRPRRRAAHRDPVHEGDRSPRRQARGRSAQRRSRSSRSCAPASR